METEGSGRRGERGERLEAAEPERDRLDFFRTQIAFWMLCAIDGHAKNFSIFLEPGGQYRLTPRYDVLSAFPVLGKKSGHLARQKIKMVMAVQSGGRKHYRWNEISRRHFAGTAKRCGIAARVDALFEDLVSRTPTVIAAVNAGLPKGFPGSVSEPIFKGLETSAGGSGKLNQGGERTRCGPARAGAPQSRLRRIRRPSARRSRERAPPTLV